MAARSLEGPSQPKPANVTALSLNPLGPVAPEETNSESATNAELKDKLIWKLLELIQRNPGLDLSLFPKQEILELITSPEAQTRLSPLIVSQLCNVLHLTLPVPPEVRSTEERFWLCDRCRKRIHFNYIYQNSRCPCKVCYTCVENYRFTRCAKCTLPYLDAQRAEVRNLSMYWSGQFPEH